MEFDFTKDFKRLYKQVGGFDLETLLKAPFPADSLSWRIGNKSEKNGKKRANMLVYIDSRDVQDRLDEVCKLCGCTWENDFKEVAGRLVCNLTISGVTRSDGAGDTDFEAEKGGLSDALKRAAVLFGVGRYLYNAKNFNTWLEYGKDDTDYSMPTRAKEEFADIARLLGESVQTYKYWLGLIDNAEDKDELNEIVTLARKYAKREQWSAGHLETVSLHIEKKQKELKEKENGTEEQSGDSVQERKD